MSGKQQKCCFFLAVLQPTRRREGGAVFKSPSKIGRWVGGIARWPPRAFEGRKARQASQSHSRATPKPTDRQPIGSQLRPQSHHKATPKPPQSHLKATHEPVASHVLGRGLRGPAPGESFYPADRRTGKENSARLPTAFVLAGAGRGITWTSNTRREKQEAPRSKSCQICC